jgi:hypothetical protein
MSADYRWVEIPPGIAQDVIDRIERAVQAGEKKITLSVQEIGTLILKDVVSVPGLAVRTEHGRSFLKLPNDVSDDYLFMFTYESELALVNGATGTQEMKASHERCTSTTTVASWVVYTHVEPVGLPERPLEKKRKNRSQSVLRRTTVNGVDSHGEFGRA